MTIINTKLSHRWGQLFNSFLPTEQDRKATPRPAAVEPEQTDESLHEFMRAALKAPRPQRPAEAARSILFVSEDNAARTQIASIYARILGGDHVFVRSVGTNPVPQVDPLVIQVLQERGIPTEDLKPKTYNPHALANVDAVILFGENSSIDSGNLVWSIEKSTDTAEDVHRMCEQVEIHVRSLLEQLGINPTPHKDFSPEFLAA